MDYPKKEFIKSLFIPLEVNYGFSVLIFFNIYKCTTNNFVEKSEDLIKILKRSERNCLGDLKIFSEPFKCLINIRNNIVHNSNKDYSKEGEDFINAISSLEDLVKKTYNPSFHQLFHLYKQYVQVNLNNINSDLWEIKESNEILNVVDRSIKDIEISESVHTLVLSSDFDDFESLKSIPPNVSTLNIDLGEKKDGEIEQYIPSTVEKAFITRTFSRKELINKHIEGEWEIDYDKPLGFGSFSIGIYKGKKLDGLINSIQISNDGYCLIEIFEFEKNMVENMVLVLNGLMGIKNENIIQFYGYAIGQSKNKKKCLFVYMEYLKEYKTIREMIINKKVFSEIEMIKIAHYLIKILVSLDKNQIIHGDIKSGHILYNESSGQVKLFGFSLSQEREKGSSFYGIFGTHVYMAPEAIQDRICSKSDIWSVGCTIIEMAGGDLAEKIGSVPIIPDSLSRKCKNFIQHCLITDVEARPQPSELIKHHLFDQLFYLLSFNQPITPNSIPSPVTELYLQSFNQPITPNSIPSSVTTLFLESFNQPITPNSIPSSVTKLYLKSFDQPITPNSIPSSVTKLYLQSFNQPITPNSIPSSVTELNLPSFNQPITPNSIPSSVKILSLPSFNQPITPNSIPSSVTELYLHSFNQPITPNSIPSSVTKLYLPSFDQPITPNSIPSSVTKLDLESFKQPITPNSIPSSVTELNLPSFNQPITPNSIPSVAKLNLSSFNQPITPNSIPSSVTELNLPSFNQPITPNSIPSSVTKLNLPSFDQPISPNSIPSSVTKLDILLFKQPITPNSIPSSVKSLFLSLFNQPITPNSIPSSVTELNLPSFDQPITPNSIPSSVTKLELESFKQPITPNSIPSSVTTLFLESFNQPITPNSIPSSVTELNLHSFNQPITPNSIPSSVTELNLQSFKQPITPNSIPSVAKLNLSSFNQPITPNSIPSSVTELYLPSFDQPITPNSIPSSVTKLHLHSFNQPITPNSIPSSVTKLSLSLFNQPITPNSIPSSVTDLYLSSFNQPITPNSIPSSVTELYLPSFNQPITPNSIPSQITKLILGKSFDLNRNGSNLPSCVHNFICDFNFPSPLKKNNNIPRRVFKLFLNNYNQKIVKESLPPSVHTLKLGSNFKDFDSFANIPSSVINLEFGVKDGNKSDQEYYKYIPSHVTSIKIDRKHSIHQENEWRIGPLIYGNVHQGTKKDGIINGQNIPNGKCAIEIIDHEKMVEVDIENLFILLNKLKDLTYDNIIKIYGCAKNYSFNLFIYMEYLKDYKSLKDELANKIAFSENQIVEITKILASSFLFLEEIAIPLGGFSIENIYMDNNKNIKIGLNLSKFYKKGDKNLSGKPIEFQKNYSESYTFNLGCLIIEMAGGNLEMLGSVPIIPDSLSDKCKNFIQNCLITDSKSRPRIIELINHEFLKDPNDKQKDVGMKIINLEETNDIDLYKILPKINIITKGIELRNFDKPISTIKNFIPSHITYLVLPAFNQKIEPNSIPSSVKLLSLKSFNKPIEPDSISPSITTLSLPTFNQSIEPETIPSSVRFLSLSTLSNYISVDSIPSQLISLTLSSFNEPNLPAIVFLLSLKSLKLPLFNQPIIQNSLPNSLISLTLSSFNHPIGPGALPSSLKFLSLPSFNHPIEPNSIPLSLKSLTLESFNQPLVQNSIPSSITLLNLPSFIKIDTLIFIPSSIKQITLPQSVEPIDTESIKVKLVKYVSSDEINSNKPQPGIADDEEQIGFVLDFKDLLKKGHNMKVLTGKLKEKDVVFIKWNGTNVIVQIKYQDKDIHISVYDTVSVKWKELIDD